MHELLAIDTDAGTRLDRFVAAHCPELSRSRVQELVDAGLILVNGQSAKSSQKLRGGELITVRAHPRPAPHAAAESIRLDVLYEDDDVIAINKAAGMTVHAGAGTITGTLVNALLGRGQALSRGGDPLRPGIVHRLDKETSGVILVAKNDTAHAKLGEAFRQRAIKKTYIALRTDWKALWKIDSTTLVEVQLHTGRTHQIRVHFSAVKHPVVGDTLYGAAEELRVGKATLPALERNFLHAAKLGFAQPRTGAWIEVRAALPSELREYLKKLCGAAGEPHSRIDAALAGYL